MDNNIKVTEQEIRDDERIDAFLRGKISDDVARQFLKELGSNEELKGKAIAMARMIKAMDKVGHEREEETVKLLMSVTEEEFMDVVKEVSKPRKPKVLPLWRRRSTILSIAASLLLLFMIGGGYQYVDYRHTQSLAETYALSFDSPTYIKGEENADIAKELSDLYQNVKEGENIDETITRLAELWELSKQDAYNDFTNYSNEIGYELAIAYLRDNDKDKAKQVLQSLKQNVEPESELGKKIDSLLKEL